MHVQLYNINIIHTMGYARLLSNKPLLVNDTMRRPFSSTSSGSHRLSNEINIDIKLYEALGKNILSTISKTNTLGKNIVSTISKTNTLGMMNPFYESQDISVHQPVHIERDDGEEGDANIIEEDDTLDTISYTSSSSSDDEYPMVSQPQSQRQVSHDRYIFNIHKDTTLDIKLLHPTAEQRAGLNGGAEDNNSHNDIDERLKKVVSLSHLNLDVVEVAESIR